MDNTWLRLLIGGAILIALLSLGALEMVTSRIPVDQYVGTFAEGHR